MILLAEAGWEVVSLVGGVCVCLIAALTGSFMWITKHLSTDVDSLREMFHSMRNEYSTRIATMDEKMAEIDSKYWHNIPELHKTMQDHMLDQQRHSR